MRKHFMVASAGGLVSICLRLRKRQGSKGLDKLRIGWSGISQKNRCVLCQRKLVENAIVEILLREGRLCQSRLVELAQQKLENLGTRTSFKSVVTLVQRLEETGVIGQKKGIYRRWIFIQDKQAPTLAQILLDEASVAVER